MVGRRRTLVFFDGENLPFAVTHTIFAFTGRGDEQLQTVVVSDRPELCDLHGVVPIVQSLDDVLGVTRHCDIIFTSENDEMIADVMCRYDPHGEHSSIHRLANDGSSLVCITRDGERTAALPWRYTFISDNECRFLEERDDLTVPLIGEYMPEGRVYAVRQVGPVRIAIVRPVVTLD